MSNKPYKSRLIYDLETLYGKVGTEWVKQNSFILNNIRKCGLVIGGSIAMAITAKNPFKIPGDIDLFTDNNNNALEFLSTLLTFLSARKNTYYKVLVNNGTKYNLEGVSNHIRVVVPFWKPICIMTLKQPIRAFHWTSGVRVQFYDDVVKAAKLVEKIDGKIRVPQEGLRGGVVEGLSVIGNPTLNHTYTSPSLYDDIWNDPQVVRNMFNCYS
jgi:hypothetical protein